MFRLKSDYCFLKAAGHRPLDNDVQIFLGLSDRRDNNVFLAMRLDLGKRQMVRGAKLERDPFLALWEEVRC